MVLVRSGPSYRSVLSRSLQGCTVMCLAILLLMLWACVQFEAVMNKAAANVCVQFFVSICFSAFLSTNVGVEFTDMKGLESESHRKAPCLG